MSEGNIFVKVNGKSFRCDAKERIGFKVCGANVFHHEGDRIVCNGCGARYIGGDLEDRTDSAPEKP